jgi:hypothetical protein
LIHRANLRGSPLLDSHPSGSMMRGRASDPATPVGPEAPPVGVGPQSGRGSKPAR